MNDSNVKTLLVLALLAVIVAALWLFRDDLFPAGRETEPVQLEPAADAAPESTAPAYPLAPLAPVDAQGLKLVPLPDLDDSDSYFLLALVDAFGADFGQVLANDALIDRFVATVDNLPRKHVPEKIRPFGNLSGNFVAEPSGDDDAFLTLGEDNFSRYDLLVGLIANADPDVIVATYRRFYPLLQESYVRLGYPDGYFNDRVVEVIDHLLATPTPSEPIALVRPHVLYEFVDSDLEALSSGQKLLIRMGNEHGARIKTVLQELRARIAAD